MDGTKPGLDPEILELFRSELDTHLPVLSSGLLALEKGQIDDGQIEAMMRAAHSIKGAARIVGIDQVVKIAHALEDCFSAAKAKKITLKSADVDVLLEGVDALQQICAGGGQVDVEGLLARVGQVRDDSHRTESPAAPVTPPAVVDHPAVELKLPAVVDEAAARSLRLVWLEHLKRTPSKITVDFGQVRALSAAGMAFLAAFAREAEHELPSCPITFRGADGGLQGLWRVTGFQDLLARN